VQVDSMMQLIQASFFFPCKFKNRLCYKREQWPLEHE